MSKLRGIAAIILSQALLVLMLFQSANGGILVLVEDESHPKQIPVEDDSRESETEISASLLSSPILNRGESSTADSGNKSQDDQSPSIDRKVAEADHNFFAENHLHKESRPHETDIHTGSIAALGP